MALDWLPLTIQIHDKPTHLPLTVVRRLSVPLSIGCEIQRQYTKAILSQDGTIKCTTGLVSAILGYHLGSRGRQSMAEEQSGVRPSEQTLAVITVLPPGTRNGFQMVTRPGRSLRLTGQAEFHAQHGMHFAHGYHKKGRLGEPFSVHLVKMGRTTNTSATGTRLGVTEPYKSEARPISQKAFLDVRKEMEAPLELYNEAMLA